MARHPSTTRKLGSRVDEHTDLQQVGSETRLSDITARDATGHRRRARVEAKQLGCDLTHTVPESN